MLYLFVLLKWKIRVSAFLPFQRRRRLCQTFLILCSNAAKAAPSSVTRVARNFATLVKS